MPTNTVKTDTPENKMPKESVKKCDAHLKLWGRLVSDNTVSNCATFTVVFTVPEQLLSSSFQWMNLTVLVCEGVKRLAAGQRR